MSEMAKKARRDMRAKANRITSTPVGKVDASGWEPPEPLRAGRKVYDKSKERSATAKVYKHGGRIQGDRGPRVRGKKARGGHADGGVPTARFTEDAVNSKYLKRGGRANDEAQDKRMIATAVHKHERHDHKGEPLTKLKRGGHIARTGNKGGDGYVEGTRPTGGRVAHAKGGRTRERMTPMQYADERREFADRMGEEAERKARRPKYKPVGAGMNDRVASDRSRLSSMLGGGGDDEMRKGGRAKRAEGGRTRKGKTNIIINIGKDAGQPPMPMPPVQMPTRPPMPPPAPPPGAGGPGGPPPGGAMAPGGPGGPGGPPIPPPSMVRKHGGRTMKPKQGVDVHMTAGAGGGLGRLEKAKRYGAHQH